MIRSRLLLALCAASLSVTACAVAPPASVGDRPSAPTASIVDYADLTLSAVEARYQRVQTIVDLVAVLLPPEQQLRVRAGRAVIAQALAAARAAVTIAEQAEQLRRAKAEIDRIDGVTGVATVPIGEMAPR